MDPLIAIEIARLLAGGEPFVLATLVEARGSTPQKAGARMLVRADGSTLGTLGGGCIEADAHAAAIDALSTGGPRLLDFELTEDIAVDYGLACGGQERILIAPMGHSGGLDRVVAALRDAVGRRGALVTLVRADDATAGHVAAVWNDGAIDGYLGARHEEAVSAIAATLSDSRGPRIESLASGAEVFVEPLEPALRVIVVGAGHVGRAVAGAAHFLGHAVAVIDDRAEFASRERFPDADDIVVGEIERAVSDYPVAEGDAVVIVTRGHKYDYQALLAAARSLASYVGLMGSRRKVALIFRQLLKDGVPAERLESIHAPIGLNIGAVTPQEIALSIVAEITAHRLGGDGRSMREGERMVERARAGTRA